MVHAIARNWWFLLVRGICAILFGFVAFGWPMITIRVLTVLFAIHALVAGGAAVTLGIGRRDKEGHWWGMLLAGFLSITGGILALAWPGLSALLLIYFIGSWAVGCGVLEIIAAIKLRQLLKNEWVLILAGLTSMAFGASVLFWP